VASGSPPPAWAGSASDRPLLETFDGADTTAGAFKAPVDLAVDQASGNVYVFDSNPGDESKEGAIDKFNENGKAAAFSALGGASSIGALSGYRVNGIAVDNSGGASQGRIYLSQFGPGTISAFAPSGSPLWEIPHATLGFQPCDVAVDGAGHLWVAGVEPPQVVEYDASGAPPSTPIGGFSLSHGVGAACRLAIGTEGSLYLASHERVDKYLANGTFAGTFDPEEVGIGARSVEVDQASASGHVFSVHNSDFREFEASGTPLGAFGEGLVGGGADGFTETSGWAIAYNSALDRVYVANKSLVDPSANVVLSFGALVSGTVPDVTIEAPTAVGVSKATFHGVVNPQGVPNSYHFEWKEGSSGSWAGAESSPPQSLPEDSSPHTVEFAATGLSGGKGYRVRLVGTNTELKLRAVSSPETLSTLAASAVPSVEMKATSAIGAESAQLNAHLDPHEDAGTTYRFQLSTDSECKTGFSNRPLHRLGTEAAKDVSEALSGLLPSQHYCARIIAENSAGATSPTAAVEFQTKAVPPSEVETAFVAPRLDTSAVLNGRVNPQGATLTYHFEYSKDGGASWLSLPPQSDTSGAREAIYVTEELSGLQPQTSYRYRFLAENAAEGSQRQGEEIGFTTRSEEEVKQPSSCPNEDLREKQHFTYLHDCRGFELVNSADTGAQHVRPLAPASSATAPIDAAGEEAMWTVFAGAPGGTTGTEAPFLARRGASGWSSQSLVPPASAQEGKGAFKYELRVATPSLSDFVFATQKSDLLDIGEGALVRVDGGQHQDLLASQPVPGRQYSLEISDDGAHVIYASQEDGKLLDIGTGTGEPLSLMPDGTPFKCKVLPFGEAGSRQWRPGYRAIAAADASRVYFRVKPNAGKKCNEAAPAGLYVRIREEGSEETRLIDPGTGTKAPEFVRATPDGRSAYFVSFSNHATLASIDPEENDKNTDADVYRWDEATGTSQCLTCVVPDANLLEGPGFARSQIAISNDFSHIYFESKNVLVAGKGRAGDVNLYVLSDGAIRYVADTNNSEGTLARINDVRLSGDGEVLLFKDDGRKPNLSADAIAAQCPDIHNGGVAASCEELYRYEDREGSIECLSCRHGAVTSNDVGTPLVLATTPSGDEAQMSDDGSTVAFATAEALLPRDVNGGTDIYEWRDGVLGLVTDGVSDFHEGLASLRVAAVSADGRDIFFTAVAPGLTGFERDELANFYDARIGGGFEAPEVRSTCIEDSCQGSLRPPPPLGQAGTATYSGPGNVQGGGRKPRCAKGQVRRHGHCAKRPGKSRHKRTAGERRRRAR
jgi:hypothetical protein